MICVFSSVHWLLKSKFIAQYESLNSREMICVFSSVHWLLKSKLIALWRSELKRKIAKKDRTPRKERSETRVIAMFVNMWTNPETDFESTADITGNDEITLILSSTSPVVTLLLLLLLLLLGGRSFYSKRNVEFLLLLLFLYSAIYRFLYIYCIGCIFLLLLGISVSVGISNILTYLLLWAYPVLSECTVPGVYLFALGIPILGAYMYAGTLLDKL